MDAASDTRPYNPRPLDDGRGRGCHRPERPLTRLHLTQRELDIMSVLWELGEATVTEVRDKVDPDLAYTSVSSMIRTLELKGYVSHRRGEGKTHVYFPVIKAEKAGESALGRVLDKIYGGSPIKLLAHLVEQNRLSEKELARMRDLLKRPGKRK
ncbi:MAG TPA: BlaI/MecI/CopY family transcriptional regulator [Gemmatimonadaceae bacterium]|nr:BlaI/MecI/CopY family transcriptional regulator [Gemmatimonadaceae bacterium]